jgi:ATP-dependent exoDNAse (exonuclease V) beta subunit
MALGNAVRGWIDNDGIVPSEIAILVSKQQGLYCQKLKVAFQDRGIPFRDEDSAQDLVAEPVACLIIDFLLIVNGSRQPAAYRRLLDTVVFSHGFDDEREYQTRSRWNRFIANVRSDLHGGIRDIKDHGDLSELVAELVRTVGRDIVVALSSDYVNGGRLQQLIDDTISRVHELVNTRDDAVEAISSFSGDQALRIMSIHKSKGLEFDTVVVLGVENETFWGDDDAERSAFFVGISRAKRGLTLTVCNRRDKPTGASRWNANRTVHAEFVGYAEPFV